PRDARSEERPAQFQTIELLSARQIRSRELAKHRKEIHRADNRLVIDASRGKMSRPAHNQRLAVAALVKTDPAAAQTACALAAKCRQRSVVAGKNQDGVVFDAQLLEPGQQSAHLLVVLF